jgi:formate dehydrogenase subunit delta
VSDGNHLVRMANDIGNFFRGQSDRAGATQGIANHMKSFWTSRMRAKLLAQVVAGEQGLDELPREALLSLASHPETQPRQPPGGDAG